MQNPFQTTETDQTFYDPTDTAPVQEAQSNSLKKVKKVWEKTRT